MKFLMGYRIQNAAALRKRYRALLKETDGPILICANHLTMLMYQEPANQVAENLLEILETLRTKDISTNSD